MTSDDKKLASCSEVQLTSRITKSVVMLLVLGAGGIAVASRLSAFNVWTFFGPGSVRAIVVEPDIFRIEATPGVIATATFSVTNHSPRPVRIAGVEASCGCVGLPTLPITVHSMEEVDLTFDVAVGESSPERAVVRHELRLFVEQSHPQVTLKIDVVSRPANSADESSTYTEESIFVPIADPTVSEIR